MVFLSIEENTDSQKGYRRCHVVVHKNERFQGFLEVYGGTQNIYLGMLGLILDTKC